MGQVLFTESIEELVLATTTTVTLAPSIINVGGQQYQSDSTLTLDFGTTGLNGLDTGAITASSGYNIFAVFSGNELGLVASLATIPSGFTQYEQIGTAVTDTSTATIHEVSNSTTPLADQTEALGNKTSSRDQADTPLISVPNTTIIGRAPIRDLSRIPSPKMGIERLLTRDLELIENEIDSDKSVYKVSHNNLDRIRCVGNWEVITGSAQGSHIQLAGGESDDPGNYMEVTFYGTGINLLTLITSNNPTIFDIDVDGIATTTADMGGKSVVLSGKNYGTNQSIPVVSGLNGGTPAIHTVRFKGKSGNFATARVYGVEILNESTTIDIPANSAILAGEDRHLIPANQNLGYALAADFDSASDNPTTDGKGGAVVVYSEKQADGSILVKQRLSTVDSTQLNLGSADHANEEVIKKVNFREFKYGPATEHFGDIPNSGSFDRTSTLDDGTTTLCGINVLADSVTGGLRMVTANDSMVLTFIGTGLDLVVGSSTASTPKDTLNIDVDGSSIGSFISDVDGVNARGIQKIVSGLPYGTHTVKITENPSGQNTSIHDFLIYGPKKPEIPEGAGKLGSYYLMADFVANSSEVRDSIGSGVLRKYCVRELVYSGSWSITSNETVQNRYPGGSATFSNTATNYVEYTFFGTGFEFRAYAAVGSSSNDITVSVDGENDFTTGIFGNLDTYFTSSWNFTENTGKLEQDIGTANQPSLSINGLPLGLHTVRLTNNTASSEYLEVGSFDIITPVHSYEASAELLHDRLIGSNAIKAETGLSDLFKEKQSFPQGVDLGASKDKVQKKYIVGNLSPGVTDVPELNFYGLTVGKTYEIMVSGDFDRGSTNDTACYLYPSNGGTVLFYVGLADGGGTDGPERILTGKSIIFTATDPYLRMQSLIQTGCLIGGGSTSTYAQLRELNNVIETDEW